MIHLPGLTFVRALGNQLAALYYRQPSISGEAGASTGVQRPALFARVNSTDFELVDLPSPVRVRQTPRN